MNDSKVLAEARGRPIGERKLKQVRFVGGKIGLSSTELGQVHLRLSFLARYSMILQQNNFVRKAAAYPCTFISIGSDDKAVSTVSNMINNYMTPLEFLPYAEKLTRDFCSAINSLDPNWRHESVVRNLLTDAINLLKEMKCCLGIASDGTYVTDRDSKAEKYTDWLQVLRLAMFQYERFSQRKNARSEGLYSTLLSLAATWAERQAISKILVPGCGPGRSVLDFATAFPSASVLGLDYSILSLMLGDRIVCGNHNVTLLRRDIHSPNGISELIIVPGKGVPNASFGLLNLVTCKLPQCDMIVCSNTINLLPNHEEAVRSLCNSLRPGGLLIFADLIGWRMDREPSRKILLSDDAIVTQFECAGMTTLDCFRGVPYIESESDDQETCYNEHFYVGRKTGVT